MPPRVLPHNREAEQAVLGALLTRKASWDHVLPHVKSPTDFFESRHQEIYSAMLKLKNSEVDVDIVTVVDALGDSLKRVGGRVYVVDLAEKGSMASNIRAHSKIIANKALYRRIITESESLTNKAYEEIDNGDVLVSQFVQTLSQVATARRSQSFTKLSAIIPDTVEFLNKVHKGERTLGVPTGFYGVDELTGGHQQGDLIIYAGRPSMGKSALMSCEAESVAMAGKKVAVVSAETRRDQYTIRSLCIRGGFDSRQLRRGNIKDDEWDRIVQTQNELCKWDYWLDDGSNQEIHALCTRVTAHKEKHGLDILYIDYLQILTVNRRVDRREQIGYISQTLKNLAMRLNIPVVLACQFSRNLEQRRDKRPQLSDLKESGDIEQVADVVVGIHRPEVYATKKEKAFGTYKGDAYYMVLKQRNGPIGDVQLFFDAKHTKFEGISETQELPF